VVSKNRLEDLSELLSAYLDGELDESARAEVVAYLERDAGAVQLLNELRETRSMLQDLPRQSAPSGFAEDVVSAVERQALLGGDSDMSGQLSPRRRWGPIRAAASVALLVGAAGLWINWQIDRRETTNLALRGLAGAGAVMENAAGESVDLEGELVVADGSTAEPVHRKDSPTHFKKDPRGKAGAPVVSSPDLGNRLHSAELETPEQQKQQSIADGDPITPVGGLDDEVVMLGEKLDPSTMSYDTIGTEEVSFGLARQSSEARWGGAVPADFSRRLQANEPAASLAFHDFSHESNSLTLSFATDAQRDEFTQDIDGYLADNGFLSAADPRERIQVVEPLSQNVVLYGRQGLNYDEPRSEQVLLNADPAVLEDLIDRYAETTGQLEDPTTIELQIGETKVAGLESTRNSIRALALANEQQQELGEDGQTASDIIDTAADPNEQFTAAQWREHFAQLGLVAKAPQSQAAVPAQSENESGKVADDAEAGPDGPGLASGASPVRKADRGESSESKEDLQPGFQTATAGEQDQGEDGETKKKRRARSARDARDDDIELFGGGDKDPPVSEPGGGSSRGRGSGDAGTVKQPKDLKPAQPARRPYNLTFVLKLRTVPRTETKPIPEMGPPAPSSESDDLKK
jgi:hypothetical protein